jgi:hypothetical protein
MPSTHFTMACRTQIGMQNVMLKGVHLRARESIGTSHSRSVAACLTCLQGIICVRCYLPDHCALFRQLEQHTAGVTGSCVCTGLSQHGGNFRVMRALRSSSGKQQVCNYLPAGLVCSSLIACAVLLLLLLILQLQLLVPLLPLPLPQHLLVQLPLQLHAEPPIPSVRELPTPEQC